MKHVTHDEYENRFTKTFGQIVPQAGGAPTNGVNPAMLARPALPQ